MPKSAAKSPGRDSSSTPLALSSGAAEPRKTASRRVKPPAIEPPPEPVPVLDEPLPPPIAPPARKRRAKESVLVETAQPEEIPVSSVPVEKEKSPKATRKKVKPVEDLPQPEPQPEPESEPESSLLPPEPLPLPSPSELPPPPPKRTTKKRKTETEAGPADGPETPVPQMEATESLSVPVVAEPVPPTVPVPEQETPPILNRRSPAMQRSRENEARSLFAAAMDAFNKLDFVQARDVLHLLVNDFEEDEAVEIVARANTFLKICEQRLSPPKQIPKAIEQLYQQGMAELERNRPEQAAPFFEKALKQDGSIAHIRYVLAVTQARRNQIQVCLTNLRYCINQDRSYRARIRQDEAFSALQENREFQDLTDIDLDDE
ncbi:MAG: hypothetical protein K1Y36_15765 [Blastocatellia bacterium]|nr:hypothetical protein [Blastocatellia bacterium]